ncbi:MAG: MFS transporter [Deltaproteobacteria bacterium]|nr:MFS transporter [Deltaproteobacteria bacterium]MBW2360189.1 MFS transporter [Deltaproteobacteria bacterium]
MDAAGRRVVAIAMSTQAVAIGTTFGSFSLFVQPLERAFDAARWQVSLGPGLLVVALAIGGMTLGSVMDRGAIRPVMLAAAVCHASALLLASQATSLLALGAAGFGLGLTVPPLGPLGGSTLIGRVVVAERGRALGIMNMGAPLGGLAFATLAGFALEAWGWRTTLLLFAGFSAVITIPAAWWVPRAFEGTGAADGDEPEADWSMARLARSPAFLLLGLVFALGTGLATGWMSQLAPYFSGLGLSLRATALVVAAGGGIAVIGTLSMGSLADRVSPALLLGVVLGAGSLCWIVYASGVSVPVAITTALVFGALTGGLMPLYTQLVAQRFGTTSLGRALGLTNLLMLPVSAISGPLAAAAYDTTGSYRVALLGFVVVYALAIFSLVASGRRLAPDGRAQ